MTIEERVYENRFMFVFVFLLLEFMENGELLNPECWINFEYFPCCGTSVHGEHRYARTYARRC